MPTTTQLGNGVVIHPVPKFTTHVVVDGTWKPKDATTVLRTDSGGEVYNYAGYLRGDQATADLVIKAGEAPVVLRKLSVLEESSPSTVKWVVLEVANGGYDGSPTKQSVTLECMEGFDPSVVEEEGEEET